MKAKAKKAPQRYKRVRLEHYDEAVRALEACAIVNAFFDETIAVKNQAVRALDTLRNGTVSR